MVIRYGVADSITTAVVDITDDSGDNTAAIAGGAAAAVVTSATLVTSALYCIKRRLSLNNRIGDSQNPLIS